MNTDGQRKGANDSGVLKHPTSWRSFLGFLLGVLRTRDSQHTGKELLGQEQLPCVPTEWAIRTWALTPSVARRSQVSDPWREITGCIKRMGSCPFNSSHRKNIITFSSYFQCRRRRKREITFLKHRWTLSGYQL